MNTWMIIAAIVVAIIVGVAVIMWWNATPYVPETPEEREAARAAYERFNREAATNRILYLAQGDASLIVTAMDKRAEDDKKRAAEQREHTLSELAWFDTQILYDSWKIARGLDAEVTK